MFSFLRTPYRLYSLLIIVLLEYRYNYIYLNRNRLRIWGLRYTTFRVGGRRKAFAIPAACSTELVILRATTRGMESHMFVNVHINTMGAQRK